MMHAMVGEIGVERRGDVALRSFAIEARACRFAGARRDLGILTLLREEGQVDRDTERDKVTIIGFAPPIGRIDAPVGALVGAGKAGLGVGGKRAGIKRAQAWQGVDAGAQRRLIDRRRRRLARRVGGRITGESRELRPGAGDLGG